ncbi:WD40/YVTN/BNR-like repeat-containing protein, partial [Flavobacterium sp.]|uniref:WD40/YVTN/BNR-like repeat-containing protein n=1 Tax=Flavobacterium sp. TaxID=239 RepID=UPI0037507EAB
MKYKLIIALLFFQLGFSQETKMSIKDYINFSNLPYKTSNTPIWAIQFYDNPDQINVNKLKTDINSWVIAEKKERKEKVKKENDSEQENELKESISENPIVQFALNFVRKVPTNWINETGFIEMPTKDAFFRQAENKEKNISNTYAKNANKNVLVNSWSQIGSKEVMLNDVQVPQSTCIYNISVAPSSTNIRLASSEAGTLYKTIDGGSNWSGISENIGPSAFHPTDVNKIMLGSNPLRISSDGGLTWTVKPVVGECNKVLWSDNGNTIIIATNSGIYVSSDAGLTFTLKQTGIIMDVKFKPGSSTIAYAINSNGIFYKSINAGLT